tara:strand:+ start:58 stop:297 length:240 start_codon:yes stop_codon:yes gene_type:complete
MSFITPNFGLNEDLESTLLSPEINAEGGVTDYLYIEKFNTKSSSVREYKAPISRDSIVMWQDFKGNQLVLTADGKLKQV